MNKKYYDAIYLRDLKELIDYGARSYGPQCAFKDLDTERNIHEYTFFQLKDDVEALGTALLARGLQGKHFAILGESSYSYVVSYFAVVNGVGVIVPLDKEHTTEELVNLVKKCDAEVLLYSNNLYADVMELKNSCGNLTEVINISMYVNSFEDLDFMSLVKEGRQWIEEGDTRFQQMEIDTLALSGIFFTSGTTGANKGVMLCHKNLVTVVHSTYSLLGISGVTISVLPINHTFEFNIHVMGSIYAGATLCFNDSIIRVRENLLKFKPNISLMVPMIVESLYKNIWKEAERAKLDQHLKYGIWVSNVLRKFGIDKREQYFKPVLEAFGGNLRLIGCGGAPLRPEIVKGLDDLGISILNGYGITECAPLISCNSPLRNIPGSVGILAPDVKVRIEGKRQDGNGEIQVMGDNVMLGYYKDEECTRKTFTEDGWFKTGDIGYLDKKGALFITGREKNLIILTNGKNVHPEELEEYLLNNLPYVKEVIVYAPEAYGQREVLITAHAYLDPEFLQRVGIEKAKSIFKEDVRRLNQKLASYKRIQDTLVRETEFEKTTTKKIKRYVIQRSQE